MEATQTQEMLSHFADRTAKMLTVWSEANERALKEIVELAAATAREGVRLCTELQESASEGLQTTQAAVSEWQTTWSETSRDPIRFYQSVLATSMDNAQRALRFWEGNAAAVSRSTERWQSSAEKARKDLASALVTAAEKMKAISAAG